jgi:hypothetical protein
MQFLTPLLLLPPPPATNRQLFEVKSKEKTGKSTALRAQIFFLAAVELLLVGWSLLLAAFSSVSASMAVLSGMESVCGLVD